MHLRCTVPSQPRGAVVQIVQMQPMYAPPQQMVVVPAAPSYSQPPPVAQAVVAAPPAEGKY